MNQSLGHLVLSSVKEYFNYRLLKDYAAFSNKTVNLYEYTDDRFPTKSIYGSPYAQWAYHAEVPGVSVPSGISAGSFIGRGTNGLALDFKNGRAILNSGNSGLTPTASVSVQEINTYVTTRPDSRIIGESNYLSLPNYTSATGYVEPNSQILSALFFRMHETENKDLAFGGNDWTSYKIRIVGLMKNSFHLTAIADLVRDSRSRMVPIMTGTPLNEYNDLRSDWNYSNYLANPTEYGFIDRSSFSFLEPDLFTEKNPKLELGVATLDFRIARFPRQEFP